LGYVHSVTAWKNYYTAEIVADDGTNFVRLCDRRGELVAGQRVRFTEKPKPPAPFFAGTSGSQTPRNLPDLSVREAIDIENFVKRLAAETGARRN
jgi:hypothetical protein